LGGLKFFLYGANIQSVNTLSFCQHTQRIDFDFSDFWEIGDELG